MAISAEDVNTELQDVTEIQLKFQRNLEDETSELRSSMPCLRKMIRPTDWQTINATVTDFADKAFWNPEISSEHFRKGLMVRFPDDRQYFCAQEACIKSVGGPESGSTVWIYLSDFSAIKKQAIR